ncbi:type II secretion system F family protein [Candidatus Micrarchaeota archaeon]|nr:type II secretion system F family protein [Candidatus Micrarchaeota archaeon]
MPETKLERLKKAVEKTEFEAASTGATGEEERASRREELDLIINKLKRKQQLPTGETEKKLIEIREHVEASSSELTRSAISKITVKADIEKTPVGRFYAMFENPLSKIGAVFYMLPATKNLKNNLDGANMPFAPEVYLIITIVVSLLAAIGAWIVSTVLLASVGTLSVATLFSSISLGFILAVIVFIGAGSLVLWYPSNVASGRANKIDKELPFALRHLATQIKAGVSLNSALASIGAANYGVLTQEITRTLADLEGGESTEGALLKLAARNRSRGLRRSVVQITRALRTGGNLAEIISSIAEDIAFESRMKIRDFTELLNIISIFYIMTAVVAPVMLTILSAVAQLPVFGGGLAFSLVIGAFTGILGLVVGIIFVIKTMEPTAS